MMKAFRNSSRDVTRPLGATPCSAQSSAKKRAPILFPAPPTCTLMISRMLDRKNAPRACAEDDVVARPVVQHGGHERSSALPETRRRTHIARSDTVKKIVHKSRGEIRSVA